MNDGIKDKHRKSIIAILAGNSRVEKAVLFGSRAMGTFTSTSDVDLALFGDELTITDQARLGAKIERLPMAQQVDLLLYRTIDNEKLREHIRKHGKEWFCRSWALMPDNLTTIGDVADVYDGPHATPKKIEQGPYFLSISSLEKGALDLSKSAHLSDEDFVKWTKRVTPQEGDVLFSYETRLGEAALMPHDIKACLGRRMGLLRPKTEKVIPEYLLYAYLSPQFQETIRSKTIHGATVDRIALKELSDFPIRIPPKDEQEQVVSVLTSISSKLQLNHRINQTLEEMAQAIFKSWFVDFEPVKAKIEAKFNGQDPERAAMSAISGKINAELDQIPPDQLVQLRATAALFPDELTDSELGPIPVGWEVKFLRDVTEIAYGKNLPIKKLLPEGYPVFGGNGVIGYYKEYLYDNPRVMVACRGAASGKVLRSLPKSFVTNNSLVIDHEKKGYLTSYYLQPCLEQCNLIDLTSGSAQPQMTIANMNPLQVIVPPKILIENHSVFISPLYREILSLERQNKSISQLRGTLLPKLLSGELELESAPISS
ncbi:restriction endonuclease subunit S [Desulfobacter postgatei]|uniref:restriction endonuclease subunit S n=1 Tax=Desulfobacter postgatei TaxID=2293 RepID=UPI00259B7D03|nr:restriction endonuclease subunit S [uncultured Desulfobacter sp.]